jgi:hypothetical protein
MPPSEELMERLRPIFNAVASGQYSDMVEAVIATYRSMLGYYNGKLSLLKLKGTDDMINLCNAFALVRETCYTILNLVSLSPARMGRDTFDDHFLWS